MIDQNHIYVLVKDLISLSKTKTYTTKMWQKFLTKKLDDIVAEGYYITPNINLSGSQFCEVANNINSGVFHLSDYLISICVEQMLSEKNLTLKSCSQVEKRKKFFIFYARKEIQDQAQWLKEKVAKENEGLFLFSKQYTLFELESDQTNEIYKLIKSNNINPEFYIRGLETKKFIIDESKIQDKEYMRFVMWAKVILNLKR